MAHFAEVDENNIVLRVLAVPDEQEHRGNDFLSNDLFLGGTWKRTSYNTKGGVHINRETGNPSDDQSKSFRKNYAGEGYIFDEERDAFIPPKIFSSWILNEETCLWQPPKPKPQEDGWWIWNEQLTEWENINPIDPVI